MVVAGGMQLCNFNRGRAGSMVVAGVRQIGNFLMGENRFDGCGRLHASRQFPIGSVAILAQGILDLTELTGTFGRDPWMPGSNLAGCSFLLISSILFSFLFIFKPRAM